MIRWFIGFFIIPWIVPLQSFAQQRLDDDSLLNYTEADSGIVVATDFPFAAIAGLETLKQGGSAVDAVLTTAITQIVLRAGMTVSYAGVVNLVYYEANTEQISTMDACFKVPSQETDPWSIPTDKPSGRTVLIPGFMAGVEAACDTSYPAGLI